MKKKDQFCSRQYRKWLTKQTCVGCRGFGACDPHHTLSRKYANGSDALCVPLCRNCHNALHAHTLTIPNIDIEIMRLIALYLKEEFDHTASVFSVQEFENFMRVAGYSEPPFTRRKNRA